MVEDDLREIGEVIVRGARRPATTTQRRAELSDRTRALMERYPLYTGPVGGHRSPEAIATAPGAVVLLGGFGFASSISVSTGLGSA